MRNRHTIALDFETYYDNEYSLRRMSVPQYILDPRYETILCAVRVDDGPHEIVDGPDFARWISQFDPALTSTICFNALFDNSILSWRYGFVPARMYDTMGMARALQGHLLASGASLAKVSEALGLPAKLHTINDVPGMRRADIQRAGLWTSFCKYALTDNEINSAIFNLLVRVFPRSERQLADMVLRCAITPRFHLDVSMLERHLEEVRAAKNALLANAGSTVYDLMSTNKFKKALEERGVEIEYKKSKTTGADTPAFAKTDAFMASLLEHNDPVVQALAAARLGHKSTIEETRAEKLLAVAKSFSNFYRDGNQLVPIPLGYGKAHTHRLAGEWGMNMQNLPSSRQGQSKLRKALIAPPGFKVVTCDLGQIEARLASWFCGAKDLLAQFATGADPYARMGSDIFGIEVDPKVNKVERFIGKTAILGLGYGCGKDRFYVMVQTLARQLAVDLGDIWTPDLAEKSVRTYRGKHKQIPEMWRELNGVLEHEWQGIGEDVAKLGPVEIGKGYVAGPTALCLQYANPRKDAKTGEFLYEYGRSTHRIYGAKFLENIIQFLARIVVMHAALRIRRTTDESWAQFVLQAHDELVYIVPDERLEFAKNVIHTEMVRPPSWAEDIPLKADVGVGHSYGEAGEDK